jgi:hypothetical protein
MFPENKMTPESINELLKISSDGLKASISGRDYMPSLNLLIQWFETNAPEYLTVNPPVGNATPIDTFLKINSDGIKAVLAKGNPSPYANLSYRWFERNYPRYLV